MALFSLPGRLPDCLILQERRICRHDGPDGHILPGADEIQLTAVDGGSMLLGRVGSESLALIRIAQCTYQVRQETLKLDAVQVITLRVHIRPQYASGRLIFMVKIQGDTEEREVRIEPPRAVADEETVLSITRSILEKETAVRASRHADIVLLDGMLEARYPEEATIVQTAREAGVYGIVKDPLIPTEEGHANEILLSWWQGSWWLRLDTFMLARLHARARFILRLDNLPMNEEAERLLSLLAWVSRDAAFPGYPYPLITADVHARISLREAELARGRILIETGRDEILTPDAHSILDTMRF